MQPEVDEDALLRILQEEEEDSSLYYDSELAEAQAKSMDRYHAAPYRDGSEVAGRSQVVTHDIEDTINWIMPHLMRTFQKSDSIVVVDDPGLDDGHPLLADASAYLFHCMFKDSDGALAVHDFAFDGLLQKMGVLRVFWEDPQPKTPKLLEGVDAETVEKYVNDPDYEILEIEASAPIPDLIPQAPMQPQIAPPMGPGGPMPGPGRDLIAQGGPPPGDVMAMQQQQMQQQGPSLPDDLMFALKVLHKPRMGKPCLEAIPPEEFRVSRRAKSLKHADYHGWKVAAWLDDLKRDYPEKLFELDPTMASGGIQSADSDIDEASDVRKVARFPEEPSSTFRIEGSGTNRQKVFVHIEYIRANVDGDDIVELRRVKRCGDVILENDIVDETEFVAWSPIRVSHRLIGRSLADTLMDIARIRTMLTRAAMDSMSQSLRPRTVVNKQMIADDETLLDRLMDHDVGDVIPVSGDPNAFVKILTTPDTSANAFQAIEYWDRRSEEASGVNRHAMGIQPDAITDTAQGIENLQAAANARVELVARWLGAGIEEAAQKMLKLIAEHQDHPKVIKVNGRKMQIDPRRWSDAMTVSIHIGNSGDSPQQKLQKLGIIAGKQEQILLQAGPNNPMVSFKEYRHTLSLMAEAMGYRNGSAFFRQIPEDWQPPDPGPNPKVVEAQEKAKMAQAEMQQKAQIAQAELQAQSQLKMADGAAKQQLAQVEIAARQEMNRAQMEHDAQLAQRKAQFERDLAMAKFESDRETARMKIEAERQIAEARMISEANLAAQRLAAEMDMARYKTDLEAANAARMGASTEDDGIDSYRPGGKLDA